MKPLDSPIVALGPILQIFRGVIIALTLWHFRKILLDGKFGFLKIALLIIGLSYISTIGPVRGSFEGYVFTTFSLEYHLLGIPETLIYVSIFSVFLFYWYRLEKRSFSIMAVVWLAALAVSSALGVLRALTLI